MPCMLCVKRRPPTNSSAIVNKKFRERRVPHETSCCKRTAVVTSLSVDVSSVVKKLFDNLDMALDACSLEYIAIAIVECIGVSLV